MVLVLAGRIAVRWFTGHETNLRAFCSQVNRAGHENGHHRDRWRPFPTTTDALGALVVLVPPLTGVGRIEIRGRLLGIPGANLLVSHQPLFPVFVTPRERLARDGQRSSILDDPAAITRIAVQTNGRFHIISHLRTLLSSVGRASSVASPYRPRPQCIYPIVAHAADPLDTRCRQPPLGVRYFQQGTLLLVREADDVVAVDSGEHCNAEAW